jgi:hypothetical protein
VDTDFDLHPFFKPSARITHLETSMMVIRLGAQPDLFDFNDLLRLFRFAFFLGQLVKKLAIVHDLAHGGLGRGRDLDQVKFAFAGQPDSVLNRNDAYVLTIRADQPDFLDTDAFIDAMISSANTLSLSKYLNTPGNASWRNAAES